MSNAAIYLHPNGYDTTGSTLLGRHSAGESFLRGFLRHANVDRFHFWNVAGTPVEELQQLVDRIQPPGKPINWIQQIHRARLGEAGVVYIPMPDLPTEAWHRRVINPRAYAICGITHTTATAGMMRLLPDMLLSPCEDYDALICTSKAVRDSVETQLEGVIEYLQEEYGPRRRPQPQRVTIPLGVNADDFATSPEHRRAWREKLDIPQDAVVALYVGRFNVRAKMNPALMALALERAVHESGQPIYWVNSGWAGSPELEKEFHTHTRELCPSVHYRNVDGRPADTRFSIWSVADFFISYSDNIQETFGLTPIEAMAAGLPCVVTDWNGYRETVRHGEDGFRIPTMAPAAGQGGDLAYWFANNWMNYEHYVGATAQFTAVDFAESTAAIVALVKNPDLRRRLGDAGKVRARQVFDWEAIIPQYQALWADQDARRRAAPPAQGGRGNPFRPDPYTLFQGYPSHRLAPNQQVALAPGMDWATAEPLLKHALVAYSQFNRPSLVEVQQILEWLSQRQSGPLNELAEIFPPGRRSFIQRGILWLARYGVVTIF